MGKHVQVDQLKTVNGQTIVGKGDIETSSVEVEVDNKTISFNSEGELQLGVKGKNDFEQIIYIDNTPFTLKKKERSNKMELSDLGVYIADGDHNLMFMRSGYISFANEEKSTHISPGYISLTSSDKGNFYAVGGEISISAPASHLGINPASTLLTANFIKVEDESKDVNHTFTFPSQAVNNNSTMVVSVNNQAADEKGNITLPATGGRDFEYEKFVRSFPPQRSVYKYDREKMGDTFGDLFLPIAKFIDYYLYDITVSFIDENGEVITTMNLPEGAEEKYASILPTEVDGKSFYIEFPS